jgi:methylenetetrahydrofolate dehydrogenase (NADP+)/methenyltetrahydrofolate cyclohydrolase
MSAVILDGKALSDVIQAEIAAEVKILKEKHGIAPGLAAILAGDNPASKIYVSKKAEACAKAGFHSETLSLSATTSLEELLNHIHRLNLDPKIHGILVQIPLPDHINENEALLAVNPEKDVDGFHPVNVGRMVIAKEEGFLPCTPLGIQTLLVRNGIETRGKHAVVIGRSNIVGKPMAIILMQKAAGADATVTVCHSHTQNIADIIRSGDIVIAAMGRAHFVKADMIKPGAVVIDVGMNRIPDATKKSGLRLCGDVDFDEVKEVAGAITPVPGGVGPMTIAMLLANTLKSAKKAVIEKL